MQTFNKKTQGERGGLGQGSRWAWEVDGPGLQGRRCWGEEGGEGEGVEGMGRVERGRSGNPDLPTMGGEKKRQPAAMNAGCLCRKMLAL